MDQPTHVERALIFGEAPVAVGIKISDSYFSRPTNGKAMTIGVRPRGCNQRIRIAHDAPRFDSNEERNLPGVDYQVTTQI